MVLPRDEHQRLIHEADQNSKQEYGDTQRQPHQQTSNEIATQALHHAVLDALSDDGFDFGLLSLAGFLVVFDESFSPCKLR